MYWISYVNRLMVRLTACRTYSKMSY